MQKCTAPPYKPVQACIKSFWLQKRLSHFSSVIAVHVSSSDTLEHDRKQAHAVYPSELSIFKTGCWLSTFFLSVLYKIFKQPSASSLGVLESYFFVFLAVFFLLNSSSTGRTQFCCYAFFWLIKQPHVAHAQIQPAFWLPSNKCIIPWILMIITRPCLVTVTRALQALVQLLAQTRDNLQYPQDNIIIMQ